MTRGLRKNDMVSTHPEMSILLNLCVVLKF